MMNQFEAIKQSVSLKDYARDHLTPIGKTYICPVCGSGTGPNHTPGFSIMSNGKTWKCFSCQAGGDIFDLAGIINHTEDKAEQLRIVASWAGLTTEAPQGSTPYQYTKTTQKTPQANAQQATGQPIRDYSTGRSEARQYLRNTQANFTRYPEALDYWTGRGFTIEEGEFFSIGYDPNQKRLVIPWQGTDYYYCSRDITGTAINGKYNKPKSEQVGAQPLYNPGALQDGSFFVVEGVLDALALKVCGYEAVCVGSNNMTDQNRQELINRYKQLNSKAVVILLLDDDEAGREGREKLYSDLTTAGIPCMYDQSPEPFDATGYKDAGEYLQYDRDGLTRYLNRLDTLAYKQAALLAEQAFNEEKNNLHIEDPAEVAADIYTLINAHVPIPTGISGLDKALDGGIKPGLIIMGAVSSLGKTTLCLQIADYLAEHGHMVMFTTIEQSAQELVSKSISRLMRTHGNTTVSAQRLTDPRQRGAIDAEKLDDALNYYASYIAPNLHILEGTKQPTVEDIKAAAEAIRYHTGKQPIIFIDYLQLMKPLDEHMTEKQATDRNVMELRQLARDTNTPIIAISSLNRASYAEGVTLEAFKESGSIEYGADVLLGLQPQGLADTLDDTKSTEQRRTATKLMREHKQANERPCELIVLKNRNGRTGDIIPLTFKAISAYFEAGRDWTARPGNYDEQPDTPSTHKPTAQAQRKARIQAAYDACIRDNAIPTPGEVHTRYVLICEKEGADTCSLQAFRRWVDQSGGYGWTITTDTDGNAIITKLTEASLSAGANSLLEYSSRMPDCLRDPIPCGTEAPEV